ncbi:MAG: hypothetical protein A3H98_10025 [Bacteroidetes bacterium RIFCSPLOWO2_02_FULL_36_8]|nr:MAG: hypothetical protein A3H98_10025 [Bacteroidetes bacterium RIFCSPLOWO2_02_FULL_36_8]OFY70398.1 MAG: hypothetical protein A3G23_09740 [Bacteroidetes bacterium RIFCSPLOWO2_12_FULL_37_12]
MITQSINRLQYLCEIIPSLLNKIQEEDFSRKLHPGKWCKKEILGHLIDSATNNHQRFIRIQYEDVPTIIYHTDNWVRLTDYKNIETEHLINLWEGYNRHLIFIIKFLSEENLRRKCKTNEPEPVSLQWLIDDYVKHLEHHLKQLVEYK